MKNANNTSRQLFLCNLYVLITNMVLKKSLHVTFFRNLHFLVSESYKNLLKRIHFESCSFHIVDLLHTLLNHFRSSTVPFETSFYLEFPVDHQCFVWINFVVISLTTDVKKQSRINVSAIHPKSITRSLSSSCRIKCGDL